MSKAPYPYLLQAQKTTGPFLELFSFRQVSICLTLNIYPVLCFYLLSTGSSESSCKLSCFLSRFYFILHIASSSYPPLIIQLKNIFSSDALPQECHRICHNCCIVGGNRGLCIYFMSSTLSSMGRANFPSTVVWNVQESTRSNHS